MQAHLSQPKNRRVSRTKLNHKCPSCHSDNMQPFYTVKNVPVHSNLMLTSQRAALSIPRGDVTLGLCQECGFISNMAYDPAMAAYSPIYEDQQSFSATFNAFSDGLVTQLIDKRDLHQKKIIEIGCGKGDFLLRLCELGDNRGIGIDPTVIPDRLDAGDRVGFIQDYYSEKYLDLKADVYICRHTFEHIYDTYNFLHTIRRAIGDDEALVIFEVPETLRVLHETAFWDIYYEHCSYFSPGALARLFRRCHFEVTDVWLGFDNQYLLLEARPAGHSTNGEYMVEESVAQITASVETFQQQVQQQIEQWRDKLDQFSSNLKKIAVWGSGSKCVAFISTLDAGENIHCVVDINPFRTDKYIPGLGKQIVAPGFLRAYKPDVVIVMNSIYKNEIEKSLQEMRLNPLVLCL